MIHRFSLKSYGDWIYRGMMFAGMIAVLWLNQNYVTRQNFESKMAILEQRMDDRKVSLEGKIDKVGDKLSDMTIFSTIQKRILVLIDDHETRLRILERLR